jgi:4-hydroxybenzoate polyprenyltransferase
MAATLRSYLELVRFSHTIFALPFAVMAALIAIRWGGDPALDWTSPVGAIRGTLGILLCMVTARTAAMAFNRLVDRTIDAANPRTAARHLPRGDVSVGEVLLLVVVSSAAFIASTVLEIVRSFSSAYFPNSWQLVLGLFLLAVIRFLPSGIGSLWTARYASTRQKGAAT